MVAKTVHGKYSYDPLALNDPGLNAIIGQRIAVLRKTKG